MQARDLLKWICNATMLVAMAFMATAGHAQAWKAGQSQLMGGKYAAAEASLTNAYKQSKSMQDKAISLKYLGVALFMQKKEAKAANIFHMALKYDPQLKLTDSEVADESVIPFFNRQKGPASAVGSAKHAAPSASGPGGRTPPGKQAAAPSVKKSKKTLVRVDSNVATAQISIDGISYGSAGSDIEVKPGTVILEITAPGYIKKAVKIIVAAFTSNTLTVNLEKPQPKAPPPKPKAVAKGIPLPSTSGSANGAKPAKGKPTGGKGSDLFASDPGSADDFSSVPVQPPQPQNSGPAQQPLPPPNPAGQAQAIAPPAPPQQPVLPPGAYGSPYQQPMYMAPPQPMYQQPMYQQPMYPQPMYQQPMYQQPMYQQPMYQQPMYQQPPAPPSVYSPGVGGGFSQQPMPLSAGPVYDPGLGSAPPLEPPPGSTVPAGPLAIGSSEPGLPPPMIAPPTGGSKKSTAATKNGKSGGCGTFIKLLPFGAGQFCQKSYMKGALFLGAEIGALYFYKTNSDYATSQQAALNKYAADRDTDQANASDPASYNDETESKKAAAKAKIDTTNSNATLSLMVFGGAWALGVADAFLFPPSPPKAKKTSKKMRLSLFMDPDVESKPTLALLSPMTWAGNEDGVWYAGYSVPRSTNESGALKLGLALDL